ncbi:hypothetical protein [Polynucleobacter antarcticus]|nr:hypothetical protein [Polynucleobacter antarcticus]
MNTNTSFLKEMGITEWTSRDAPVASLPEEPHHAATPADAPTQLPQPTQPPKSLWWFFGNKPQGDTEVLFQNVIRVLGLSPQEWSWKNPAEKIDPELLPQDGIPIVAVAFGGVVAQKLSGERDALPQLRETVLAFNTEGAEDLPLIATFELSQLVARPKDKALFWQDLLLAKSVLQNT